MIKHTKAPLPWWPICSRRPAGDSKATSLVSHPMSTRTAGRNPTYAGHVETRSPPLIPHDAAHIPPSSPSSRRCTRSAAPPSRIPPTHAPPQGRSNDPASPRRHGARRAPATSRTCFHPIRRGARLRELDMAVWWPLSLSREISAGSRSDISDPTIRRWPNAEVCFTEQGDVRSTAILLFRVGREQPGTTGLSAQGVQNSVSKDRMVGIRIFKRLRPENPSRSRTFRPVAARTRIPSVPDPTDKGSRLRVRIGPGAACGRAVSGGCRWNRGERSQQRPVPDRNHSRAAGEPGIGAHRPVRRRRLQRPGGR